MGDATLLAHPFEQVSLLVETFLIHIDDTLAPGLGVFQRAHGAAKKNGRLAGRQCDHVRQAMEAFENVERGENLISRHHGLALVMPAHQLGRSSL